jgi:hypothetical protein
LRDAETTIALDLDGADQAQWAAQQQSCVDRLHEPSDEPAIEAIRDYTAFALRNRDWLCLASAPGLVRSRADGFVQFSEGGAAFPRLSRPPHAVPDPGSLEAALVRGDYELGGALECWLGPPGEGALYVLASAVGVHVQMGLWTGENEPLEEFLSTVRSNRHMIELADGVREVLDTLLEQQTWFAGLITSVDESLDAALNEQASAAVALFGGTEASVETLWDDGFDAVFEDLNLLRAVVACGLLGSVPDGSAEAPSDQAWANVINAAYVRGMTKEIDLTDSTGERLLI